MHNNVIPSFISANWKVVICVSYRNLEKSEMFKEEKKKHLKFSAVHYATFTYLPMPLLSFFVYSPIVRHW